MSKLDPILSFVVYAHLIDSKFPSAAKGGAIEVDLYASCENLVPELMENMVPRTFGVAKAVAPLAGIPYQESRCE